MLTFIAPFVAYILSFPVMLLSLSRVEFGLLFFITVIPLITVMHKWRLYPMGHNIPDFLLVAMVAGWCLRTLGKGTRFCNRSTLNFVVILVVLESFVSLVNGNMLHPYFAENSIIRLTTWKNYMILPLLYFITFNNIRTEKAVNWLIICICLSMLVMDFNFYTTFKWIKSTHYSHSLRISGAFSSLGSNELGIFYSMYTFILLGIAYHKNDRKWRYAILFVCACNLYCILFSYSRSAYICTFAGFITFSLLRDRRLLLIPIALVLFYSSVLPTSVVERIDMTFLNTEETGETQIEDSLVQVGGVALDTVGRKALWDKAKEYFALYPLMGIGFDTFRYLEGMITHSLYLRIMAEQGLFGSIVFLIFIVTILQNSYKVLRHSETRSRPRNWLWFLLLYRCIFSW